MKVIMLETRQGSPDGIEVNTYFKDESYDIVDSLYKVFKKLGWCKDFVEVKTFEEPIQEKKIEVPENKMADEPRNKRKGKE
jgi:hypothetical protein